MEATLTLSQAGRQLGVDDDALSRLIRLGALPEAQQRQDEAGPAWVIPERVLPMIAARNGWSIDLRGARALVAPTDEADASAQLAPVIGEIESTAAENTMVESAAVENTAVENTAVENAALEPVETTGDGAIEAVAAGVPSVTEVIDLALLDRLLGAQEERVMAEARAQESRNALSALNQTHNRITSELEVERHERMVVTDRYREERLARAASDAKVTELRNRVTREVELAESERQARAEALDRIARAEREAANAFASMGWLARRRFRRLNEATVSG